MKTKLAVFLKTKREEKGITRKELAFFGGISVSTMGQIENGSIKKPPMKRLEGFAACLEVPLNTITELLN